MWQTDKKITLWTSLRLLSNHPPLAPPHYTCHLQRSDGMQRTQRVAGAQVGPLHHVVVGPAEESVFPQSELVPRDELAAARHAAKALDVVDLGASPHHEVVLGEADVAFRTFDAV